MPIRNERILIDWACVQCPKQFNVYADCVKHELRVHNAKIETTRDINTATVTSDKDVNASTNVLESSEVIDVVGTTQDRSLAEVVDENVFRAQLSKRSKSALDSAKNAKVHLCCNVLQIAHRAHLSTFVSIFSGQESTQVSAIASPRN